MNNNFFLSNEVTTRTKIYKEHLGFPLMSAYFAK